ncbi:MAG: hypothetical protein IPL53_17465 [Ignavibacteria bacterium]|nr:hypothetical protein [Ignavibacteria bacterium]
MKVYLCIFMLSILSSAVLPDASLSQDYDDKRYQRKRNTYKIWEGTDPIMTASKLAAYCAPIFWFSADEPELRNREGKNIKIPAPFPFESKSDSPVVYYQITYILNRENAKGKSFTKDYFNYGNSIIDLSKITAVDIYYSHYYRYEAGLGSHQNDTEQAQFQFLVRSYIDKNNVKHYFIFFVRVTAKAHALEWYDNIYEIDTDNPDYELSLPFHILVEEGKHASCSDINGDGYYTPGYDVNVRRNDAWGLRDVIRTGELFSSDFKSYMAKVRRPEFRVFPPLPEDSPLRKKYTVDGVYAPDNAVYQLRPMPSPKLAKTELLRHDMKDYYFEYSPYISNESEENDFLDWFIGESFINSLGVSWRIDDEASGPSLSFPLLIVKNVEAPLIGGWLVNRVYLQGNGIDDFGYNILYTPSASRFLDPYLSFGLEIDNFIKNNEADTIPPKTDFVFETGIKIRGNVTYSPLKFLSFLSPFWGVRLGVKNTGFMKINDLNYVIEIGAGVW